MPALKDQTAEMLHWRQSLIREVIRKCRTDWQRDEGVEAVKVRHDEKLAAINAELQRRRREAREATGAEKPFAPICQMKPVALGANAPGRAMDIVKTARQVLANAQEAANG